MHFHELTNFSQNVAGKKNVVSFKHLLVWSVMDEVPDDPQQ